MGIVLDSSVFIHFERSSFGLEDLLAKKKGEEFFISAVTASELLHGVHRATKSDVRQKRSSFVEAILSKVPCIEIDLRVARAHALLWVELLKQGNPLSMNDSWIAATCLAYGYGLITFDKKGFTKVKGLEVVA